MAQDKNRRQVIKNIGLGAGALGMASISKVFAANASEEKNFRKSNFRKNQPLGLPLVLWRYSVGSLRESL